MQQQLTKVNYPVSFGLNNPPMLNRDPMTLHQFRYGVKAWIHTENQFFRFYGHAKTPYQNSNLTAFRKGLGNSDGIILDVGANIGLMSYQFATWGYEVVAFEPTPKITEMMAHNMCINGVSDKVTIYQNAVSSIAAVLTMRDNFNNSDINSVVKNNNNNHCAKSTKFQVYACALDDLKLPKVAGIKIDTEGHEFEVIKGAANLIDKDRPVILAEILGKGVTRIGRYRSKPQDLYDFMIAVNYRIYNKHSVPHTIWKYTRNNSDMIFVPKERDPLHNELFA